MIRALSMHFAYLCPENVAEEPGQERAGERQVFFIFVVT